MKPFVAAALVAALLLPATAQADEVSRLGNVLAAEQIVDIIQTQAIVNDNHCGPSGCVYGVEQNPLARPFAHSVPASLAVASGVNLLARHLIGPNAKPWLLRALVGLYPLVLLHNAHEMRVQANFKI
jgi:hypothetical protein